MKKTEQITQSSANTTLGHYTYNTPNIKSSMRSPKSITEFSMGNKIFDHIEKEVNSTLTALNNERLKQTNVIDKVKKELKVLSKQANDNPGAKSYRTASQPKDDYVKSKYESYIRAQESQLKRLEKELVSTKENLQTKEEMLKSVVLANKELTEQVDLLKQQIDKDSYIKTLQTNLLHIIEGKEEYIDTQIRNPTNLELEELLKIVENLINNLIAYNQQTTENRNPLESIKNNIHETELKPEM